MNLAHKLHKIYRTLYSAYGPQSWWPADTPFEVMVGAILTQNTNWKNVEKAISGLKEVCALTPEGVLALSEGKLQAAIRSSGYFRQKAERLRGFCQFFIERYEGKLAIMDAVPTETLRRDLLAQKGIGPETADSILLYALGRPSFVVDSYTIRLLSRLGLCDEKVKYEDARDLFMNHLEPGVQVFNEYHALIVTHSKVRCRKREPECGECVLAAICAFNLRSQISDLR